MSRGNAAQPRRWHESSVFLLLLSACCLIILMQFHGCMQRGQCIFAEDFEVFYNPAHQMAAGLQTSPYPLAQAKAWVADPDNSGTFHFSLYPPYSLLLFYPLGLLAPHAALCLWFGLQLAAITACCCTAYVRQLVPYRMHLLLLVPFTIISLLAGQVGTLCAALFALTLAWRKSRPFLAAFALTLLTLKPQLALMLPVLLLAERNFRVLCIAGCLFCAWTGLSFLLLGTHAWQDYLALLALAPRILAIAPPQLLTVSLSPALALRMLGVSAQASLSLQTLLSLAVVLLSLSGLKAAEETRKVIIIATATFLISPYSFHYDAVLLLFPCFLLMRRWREGTITRLERIALITMAFIPLVAIKIQAMRIPYGFLSILAGFLAGRRLREARE